MECHVEIQSGEMSPLIRISVEQPVIAQGTFESLWNVCSHKSLFKSKVFFLQGNFILY